MSKKIKLDLDCFLNHFVEVITTAVISSSAEAEGGIIERTQPIVISGFFLGHDEKNIYMGSEPGFLSDVLNKDHIIQVGASKPKDKFDDLFDDVSISKQDN